MKGLEAYGYGEDLANLAPRSQKPGTCSSFSEWLGKVWETLLLWSSLGMKMFPRHPLVMLRVLEETRCQFGCLSLFLLKASKILILVLVVN